MTPARERPFPNDWSPRSSGVSLSRGRNLPDGTPSVLHFVGQSNFRSWRLSIVPVPP